MVRLNNEVELILEYDRKLSYGDKSVVVKKDILLYRIVNRIEVLENPRTLQILMELDHAYQDNQYGYESKVYCKPKPEFEELEII